jgi:hypothetical protein
MPRIERHVIPMKLQDLVMTEQIGNSRRSP